MDQCTRLGKTLSTNPKSAKLITDLQIHKEEEREKRYQNKCRTNPRYIELQWAWPICRNSGRIMPMTEAIKSLIDFSEDDGRSRGSPYPFTCISRAPELGLFSCIVCMATYLKATLAAATRHETPRHAELTRKCLPKTGEVRRSAT